MKTIYAAVAGLAILAAPAAVWAATGDGDGGHRGKMWEKIDANHDGQVTKGEAAAKVYAMLQKGLGPNFRG